MRRSRHFHFFSLAFGLVAASLLCPAVALASAATGVGIEPAEKRITHLEIESNTEPPLPVDAAVWRGKTTVIYAWGDWCRICLKTTPEVIALAKANADVRFIFINTDDPAHPLSAEVPPNVFDAKVSRTFFGDETMRKKGFRFSGLGLVFAVPAYFILDAQGALRNSGNGSRFISQLAQTLRDLPSAKLSP